MGQRKIIPRKQRKLSQVLHRGKPEVSFEGQHHALGVVHRLQCDYIL